MCVGTGPLPPTVNPRAPRSLLSLLHTCSQSHQKRMTYDCVPPRPSRTITIPLSQFKIQTNRRTLHPSLIYPKFSFIFECTVHLALLLASNNQIQAMKHLVCKAASGNALTPSSSDGEAGEPFGLRFLPPAACCV